MPSIYEVRPDLNNFQTLSILKSARFLTTDRVGKPLSALWKPPQVFVPKPKRPKPDIWQMGAFGFLILEANALSVLGRVVEPVGELLPMTFEKRRLTVLNLTHVTDCVEMADSEIDVSKVLDVSGLAIDLRRIEHSLFWFPEVLMCPMIYATEGVFPPEMEFKALVEKHGLSGLWFRKAWSDDTSGGNSSKRTSAKAARKKAAKPKAAKGPASRKKKPKKKA